MELTKKQSMTIEKEYKFATQILIYTVLFAVTAIGVYLTFILCDRTFLSYNDGKAQAYPILVSLKHFWQNIIDGEGAEAWSWSIGLGGSYFDYFKSRLMNPFTYMTIAFPEEYLDIAHSVVTVIRQCCCGIAFMFFAREVDLNQNQRIIGGLCYAFSGWIVYVAIEQAHFLNVALLFPLLIMGAEKVLKKKSPILFIIIVALLLVSSILWAYISAIMVIAYYFVRYFSFILIF